MRCPSCGTTIDASAARCPVCRAEFAEATRLGSTIGPSADPAPFGADATTFGDGVTTFGDGATTFSNTDGATTSHSVPPASNDNGPLKPGQTFGARYHIIRALGVGGMGAVYQAWDTELGVAVAIKVIRPDVMADPAAASEVERRFKRELLLARQVTHKSVVRIHDLGEIDGVKYITMTYVDGTDLAGLLEREGRLPVPAVMRIARPVVSGLVEAHKAGVVHRDLKPANIMIDSAGDALIMDFGIARSSGGPAAASAAAAVRPPLPAGVRRTAVTAEATRYAGVVGTIEYMAPEQARGEEVDQRADIYAFGLILYTMLVGREHRALHAESAIAELRARMEHPPTPVKAIVTEVPDAVDRLITRCLEPDPAKRYQTSEELAADLNRLDDDGTPIPEPRRFTPKLIATSVAVVALLVTGTWWLTRTPPPPKVHDPVAVVIADFQNATDDPTFDHTLEQTLRRGLEGAGFIAAYDRTRIRGTFGVRPPDRLDETAARELAVKQGVGVVVSGSIQRRGDGYEIAVKATQTMTGKDIAGAKGRATSKDQVLGATTSLVSTIRKALGDDTSSSAQLLAMKSLSTSSLDVVSHYAAAIEAQSKSRYEDARQSFLKAVELDPRFGLGYQGLAVMSRNLGKLQDAETYAKEALRYLDGMTERERFATRGMYYRMTGDLQQCVSEYGELLNRYSADTVAHNQRAICLGKLRNMQGAMAEMRRAVQILPNQVTYRANLALFADYAGDFAAAEREVRAMKEPDARAISALALSQLGQGLLPAAADTYRTLGTMGRWGASFAASGLGDVALYEGRFADAVRILEEGAAADLAANNADSAAMKYAALAYAHVMRGETRAAAASAGAALDKSTSVPIRFLTARVLVEAGDVAKAQKLAAGLASEIGAEPRAYGKIVEGDIALKKKDATQAVQILTDANKLLDTWLGHFDLGRAYLELRAFPQADSEFDRCIKRRGEALSLLDEDPTFGYFPPVHYYQGRAREGLGTAAFAESYREYLNIRGKSTDDPLLAEVRRRADGP